MPDHPRGPTEEWTEFTDTLLLQRDAARAEVTALTAELQSAQSDAEHFRNRKDELVGILRGIVNNPLMPRDQVQSRLLNAVQKYE